VDRVDRKAEKTLVSSVNSYVPFNQLRKSRTVSGSGSDASAVSLRPRAQRAVIPFFGSCREKAQMPQKEREEYRKRLRWPGDFARRRFGGPGSPTPLHLHG